MTFEQQLWNDFGFRQLLNDLFKARKDAELGPMRLAILTQYVQAKAPTALLAPNKGIPESYPKPQLRVAPAIELTPEERATLKAETAAAIVDPMQSANEAADIVAKSIKEGKWAEGGFMNVRLRSDRPTGQLKELLTARGVHVSNLEVSLDPGALGNMADKAPGFWMIRVSK